MPLIAQNRVGLFSEHLRVAPVTATALATTRVVEALKDAGATVTPLPSPAAGYEITLGEQMPAGIVALHHHEAPHLALRMRGEPGPGRAYDCWTQIDWTPCPVCGAPVVWYEAGYVPGYRVCVRPPHHHSLAT